MERRIAPRGAVRRRLVVAFILVAAVSAGVLAVGSFFLVRESRLDASLERGEEETRFGLRLAADLSEDADLEQFVSSFGLRGIRAVLDADGERIPSEPGFNPAIPGDLTRLVDQGHIAFQRQDVDGVPYLITGGQAAGTEAELFFFFNEGPIHSDLADLRNILAAGWLVVVAAAAVVGRFVAGRTLAPVGDASRAARALAEGLLDTRLPRRGGDEFGVWATSFNEMAEALQGKITALSEAQARERRFTADVAHELRTPLTALVTEASVLREHLDRIPEEARRPAELLVADVARLRRLLEELMEISRLDAGRVPVRRERVDLRSVVTAVVRSRGWEASVEVGGEGAVVEADPRRVERIVSNLVGNAVRHGRRDVSVRVGREGAGAFVRVADRGPGIPPEHLPRVFDRFYKADPARSGGGSGLGLAIAMENARLLGGDLRVRSEVGAGTTFTLRLPVTPPLPGGDGPVASDPHDGARTEKGGTP